MDQRTCRSYSLPCFSFPVFVDGFHGDVVGGDRLQALHDGRGGTSRNLEGHFLPPTTGDIFQSVMAHPTRRWCPCDLHGLFSLV